MKKRFFLLVIIFFIYSPNLNSQSDSIVDYHVNYQYIHFNTEDTSYQFTIFIEQNGLFRFEQGFLDTSIFNRFVYTEYKKGINTTYNKSFCFTPQIREIEDHFNLSYEQLDPVISLKLSYLIDKLLGEQTDTSRSMIRLLYPCDKVSFYNEFYFFEIKEISDVPTLFSYKFNSTDIKGIKLVHKEVYDLRKKDVANLKKKTGNIESIDAIVCINSRVPYLFEFNINNTFRRHIYSPYCRVLSGSQKKVNKSFNWFLNLIGSYTDLNCSQELKMRYPKSVL